MTSSDAVGRPLSNPTDSAEPPREVDRISNELVSEFTRAMPTMATLVGLESDPTRLDDLSPDGLARRNEIATRTRAAIAAAPVADDREVLAQSVAVERLDVEIDISDSGWRHADLNVIDSPLQMVRLVFDLMPTDTLDDRETIAARMHSVPDALSGYATGLRYAADQGHIPAARQVAKCAEQCAGYAGGGEQLGFFTGLARQLAADSPTLEQSLTSGAQAADDAFRSFGAFLSEELLPQAPAKDAVGRERYSLSSRDFLGAVVDLDETYAWGWDEFLRIEDEMRSVAGLIVPGGSPAEAAAALDADHRYQISGQSALKEWMQRLSDDAVVELGRTHFDIPEQVRRLECLIAPPGGTSGAYYTPPSDDLSRPGRMWWSVDPTTSRWGVWRETTTVYHEGVPGHHLQLATAVLERQNLNDFQRLLATTSGHAEGWALYAERLVRELGYLDDPGNLLGMLDGQLFRAARVVLDIGMHLEMTIPPGTGFHEGERWTPDLGLEFLHTRTLNDPANSRDEIDRYLGWPGQAPAYKVGERVWLEGRDAAKTRHGSAFDFKDYHNRALRLGNMGLDPLARQLALI